MQLLRVGVRVPGRAVEASGDVRELSGGTVQPTSLFSTQ
jgi:hypothetical protein